MDPFKHFYIIVFNFLSLSINLYYYCIWVTNNKKIKKIKCFFFPLHLINKNEGIRILSLWKTVFSIYSLLFLFRIIQPFLNSFENVVYIQSDNSDQSNRTIKVELGWVNLSNWIGFIFGTWTEWFDSYSWSKTFDLIRVK